MDTEISLIEDLRGGGFDASLITTYNAYLPFYEEVVLRRLIAAGCRHNVVLMDHAQCFQALVNSSYRAGAAGSQYTLIPIRVAGSFHPKVTFLAGAKSALALVGSHNLTISGFGYNREITNRFEAAKAGDPEAIRALGAVWSAVASWIRSQDKALPREVIEAGLSVGNAAQWIREEPDINGMPFLASGPGRPNLWDQLRPHISFKVQRVAIAGPFFDEEYSFVTRVHKDLEPKQIVVAIEPDTVALGNPRHLPNGTRLVDGASLGGRTGYLHAKAILCQGANGKVVLATGSANAGFSAWLAKGMDRNAEAIVVQTATEARNAAAALGFDQVFDLPKLTSEQIASISAKRKLRAETVDAGMPVVVAVEDNEGFKIGATGETKTAYEARILGAGRVPLGGAVAVERQGDVLVVPLSDAGVRSATCELRLLRKDAPEVLVLVHHAEEIAQRARTGRQAQFRAALASLSSATPDLARLITLVGDIIFDSEAEVSPSARGRREEAAKPTARPGSLAVSIRDIHRRRAIHRLVRSGDFGYLLDVLIHRLGVGLETRGEEVDRLGRSEEEQRRQDDDSPTAVDALTDKDVAATCRRKVRTLVSRMASQLELAATGKALPGLALVQLLAVLATIRELRIHEQQPKWRMIGESLINDDDRVHLLMSSLAYLYGRRYALMKKTLAEAAVDDQPDEVQRLPGLLLWLAWDCGLRLDERSVYGEEPEEAQEKAAQKAVLLALSPAAASNAIALQEVEASILKTARPTQVARASAWLKNQLRWVERLSELRTSSGSRIADQTKIGDLAYLASDSRRELYVVSTVGAGFIGLVDLSDIESEIRFLPDRVVTVGQTMEVQRGP